MWPLFTAMALAPVIGLVAWWVSTLDRLDPEALAKLGAARGWSVQPTRDDDEEAVTLAPNDGGWTIRVSRRIPRGGQSTKVSRSGGLRTVWQAAVACPKGVLAIRPGQGPKGQLAPSPDMLAWLFARATGAAVILSPAGLRLAVAGKALSDGAKLDAIVAAGERLRAACEGVHDSG